MKLLFRCVFVASLLLGAGPVFAQTMQPHVKQVLMPVAGTYRPGNVLTFAVRVTATPVRLSVPLNSPTGRPRLLLNIGGQTRYAPASWLGRSGDIVGFNYTVTAEDAPASGITLAPAIDLNGSEITVNGAAVDPSLATAEVNASGGFDGSGIRIGAYSAAPLAIYPARVTGCAVGGFQFGYTPMTNAPVVGTYSAQGVPAGMTVGERFSQLMVSLSNPGTGGAYGRMTANITIHAGGASAPVTLCAVPPTGFEYLPDPFSPGSVATPPAGTYRPGDTLRFALTYPEPISVAGSPRLRLSIGGRDHFATAVPSVAANVVAFEYVVAADDQGVLALPHGAEGDCVLSGQMGDYYKSWRFIPDTSGIMIGAPMASPTLRVAGGDVLGEYGASFTHQLSVTNADAATVTYDVLGLPQFLMVDHQTGVVSGRPDGSGRFVGTVIVSDRTGTATAPITFHILPSKQWLPPPAQPPPKITTHAYAGRAIFSGTAVPGWQVELKSLDELIRHFGATVSADGTWTIEGPSLANGTYAFKVAGTAPSGFDRQESDPVILTVDEPDPTAPHVTIDRIVPVAIGTVGNWTIEGRAPPGAAVTLELIDSVGSTLPGQIGTLTADGEGRWTASPGIEAAIGNYVFSASAGAGILPSGFHVYTVSPMPVLQTAPPPPPPPPPEPVKQDQTITFASPVSAIVIGQPILLGALSSAGLPITYAIVTGDATLSGNTLIPRSTARLVVRASSDGSDDFNPATVDVDFGAPQKAAQAIQLTTPGGGVPAERPLKLAATATSGLPVRYAVVSGPATIQGDELTFTGTGDVVVRASQSGDGTYASASDVLLTFTAKPVDRLVNVSSRVTIQAGDSSPGVIAGFVVSGAGPKQILIRAVGPSLSAFGVANPLASPRLEVFGRNGDLVARNSGWADDGEVAAAGQAIGAFALRPGSKDAALLLTLAPGIYTAQVTSTGPGTVLLEVYDVAANAAVPTKQLVNLSTRGRVGAGQDALAAGFVIAGTEPKRVLIRGIGPGLAAFGVADSLNDPTLMLYAADGTLLARNDDWEMAQPIDLLRFTTTGADVTAANLATGAFGLSTGSKDAALLLTLNPGTYSVVLSGAHGATGAAMIEVYEVESATP